MRKYGEFIVANCDPETDLPGVIGNLKESGQYVHGQDDEKTLRMFLGVVPDTILVAKEQGYAEVAGNISILFGPIPLLARLAVGSMVEYPKRAEVTRVLYNGAFDVLRKRGAPQAEFLSDWHPQRPTPIGKAAEFYESFGFRYTYDLFAAQFDLWDEHGNPTPNIPPFQ